MHLYTLDYKHFKSKARPAWMSAKQEMPCRHQGGDIQFII